MIKAKITMEYEDFKQLEKESSFYKKENQKIYDFLKANVKVTDGECQFEGKDAPCDEQEENIKCSDCPHFKQIEYEIKDKIKFGKFLAELMLDV